MGSFAQIVNFVMGLIDFIKKLFGGSDDDGQSPDVGDGPDANQ